MVGLWSGCVLPLRGTLRDDRTAGESEPLGAIRVDLTTETNKNTYHANRNHLSIFNKIWDTPL